MPNPIYKVEIFVNDLIESIHQKMTLHDANILGITMALAGKRIIVRGYMDSFIWDSNDGLPELMKKTVRKSESKK